MGCCVSKEQEAIQRPPPSNSAGCPPPPPPTTGVYTNEPSPSPVPAAKMVAPPPTVGGGGIITSVISEITSLISPYTVTDPTKASSSCGRYPDKFRRILELIKGFPLLDYNDYAKNNDNDDADEYDVDAPQPLDINLDYWEIGLDGIKMLVAALDEANNNNDEEDVIAEEKEEEEEESVEPATSKKRGFKCRKIRKLGLDHNQIGPEGVKLLIDFLCNHDNTWIIEELDLGHNDIEDEGAISISSLLNSPFKAGRFIQKVSLDYNGITDEGMSAIASCVGAIASSLRDDDDKLEEFVIQQPSLLHSLNLADNNIGNIGCHKMVTSLSTNVLLRELNLSGNDGISAEMEVLVKERIRRNSVKYEHEQHVNKEGIMYYVQSSTMVEGDEEMLGEQTAGPGMFTRVGSKVRGAISAGSQANTKVGYEGKKKQGDGEIELSEGVSFTWDAERIMEATAFDGAAFSALLIALKDVVRQCDGENSISVKNMTGFEFPTLPIRYRKHLRDSLARKMLVDQKMKMQRSVSLSSTIDDGDFANVEKNDDGDASTILHLTVAAESPCAVELSKLLVENFGANLDGVKDNAGRTARTIALANRNRDMISWARSVGTIAGRYRRLPGPPVHQSATCTVFFAIDEFKREGSGERDVALKEMKNESHYRKELSMRLTIVPDDLNEAGDLTTLNRFDVRHVVPVLRAHELEAKASSSSSSSKRYILVMPRGERNLLQAVSDERMSRDPEKIVYFVRDIVPAVVHLHNDHNIIHCDLKPRNFVRIQGDWKLIDFDASVKMGDTPGKDKFSGGYIPPELARALFHPTKNRYELQKDLNVRKAQLKLAMGKDMSKLDLGAVQSILADCELIKDRMKQIDDGKSSNDLNADPTFDVWSFGIVLYLLLTGTDLFNLNIGDDQLADEKARTRLVRWDGLKDEDLSKVLSYWNAKDDEVAAAKDLLTRCLHPDPKLRIPSMQHVLNHPFFAREVNSNRSLEELQSIKDEIVGAVGEKIDNAIRANLSIRDATLPSLWVLLPSKRKGKMACMKENLSLYGKYKLYMICQATGRCSHEPINLFFMKTGAKNALIKSAPLILSTIILLKAGLVAGKVAGIPLPSSLPFLDELHDHISNTDAFAMDDLDQLTKHFQSLATGVASQVSDDIETSNLVSHLTRAQEQNRKAGLETCDQLRCLLKAGQSIEYTDEEVATLAKLQRMVHPDGTCIWVDRNEHAKKKAKEYGYIESEMNMLNYDIDIVLDENDEEGEKEPIRLDETESIDTVQVEAKDASSPEHTFDAQENVENKEDNQPPLTTEVSTSELLKEEKFHSAKNVFDDTVSGEDTEINDDENLDSQRDDFGAKDSSSSARVKKRSQEEQFYSSLMVTST